MSAVSEPAAAAAEGAETRVERSGRPSLPVAGLHLGALWAFALVQPLFDLLGRNAQFFAARGNTAGDILLFALAFALVPPLALLAVEWVVGRIRPTAGWALHLVLVAGLSGLVVLPVTGDLLAGSSLSLVAAALVGAGVAALYARARGVRSFLTVLAPAPVLFLVLFLVGSPVSKLVFPSDASASVVGPARSDTPVVFVIFDELATTTLMGEGGRIDREQFPNLARLADDATWYRNATTVADGTTEAVPALLTGNLPREGEVPTPGDHPRSLFTYLARSHDLHVVEPQTDVCPERLCGASRPAASERLRSLAGDLRVVSLHLLLPDDMRDSLPAVDRGWEGFGDEAAAPALPRTPEAIQQRRQDFLEGLAARQVDTDPVSGFRRLIESLRPGTARPPLAFLHVGLPHFPWRFLPDGQQYVAHRNSLPGVDEDDRIRGQALADQGFQRHLLQTGYVDRLVGQVLERLRSTGLYDRSLVVMTADHGVSFRDGHGRRRPDAGNLADIAGVPLIVKEPGQREGRVDDSAVRTIDVLPTVAEHVGGRLPWGVDGVPASERGDDADEPIAVSHVGESDVSLPFGRFLAQRDERERYEQRLLGAGRSLFAIGPRPALVGRPVDELSVAAAARGARVQLDAPAGYAAVDPGSGVLPAYVSGAVDGLREGDEIAVVVRGRVEATTRVFREGETLVFAAMVPPSAFRAGRNRVEVFQIAGAARLRALGGVRGESPYELREEADGEVLVHGAERFAVTADTDSGFVDGAVRDGGVILLKGWAGTPDLTAAADQVVAFAGRRQLRVAEPGVVREDLGAWKPGLRTAGFQFEVPAAAIRESGRLRVFAVSSDGAAPLELIGNVPQTLDSLR